MYRNGKAKTDRYIDIYGKNEMNNNENIKIDNERNRYMIKNLIRRYYMYTYIFIFIIILSCIHIQVYIYIYIYIHVYI